MPASSSAPYPFGDLLALARQSWLGQLEIRLAERGLTGYRRSDAAALRRLRRGPIAIGELGTVLGVTRQAARKVAEGLARRGLASLDRDSADSRQLNITLTEAGHDYALAVIAVIAELNQELAQRVDPALLAAADSVLRAALFDDSARRRATRLPRPPGPGDAHL